MSNRIPKTLALPSERAEGGVLEFKPDVQEARFSSLEYTQKLRPAPSGISIGHINVTAGTLEESFSSYPNPSTPSISIC